MALGMNGGTNGHLQKTITVSPTTGEMIKPKSLFDADALRFWIRDHADPGQKKLQCVTFTLQHYDVTGWYVITAGHVPKELKGDDRDRQIQNIVFEFEQASRVQADTNPRQAQHFRVGGHLTDKREDRADIQFSFLVKSEDAHAFGFHQEPGEAFDVATIISGQQRLSETQSRQGMSAMQQCMDRLLDSERDLRKSNQELLAQSLAMFKAYQEALDQGAEREIRVYREKRSIDLENQVLAGLVQYGFPVGAAVLQKFTGVNPSALPQMSAGAGTGAGQIGPSTSAAGQLTDGPVSGLFKDLDPKQLVQVLDVLNAEQKAAFMGAAVGQKTDLFAMLKSLRPKQLFGILSALTREQRAKYSQLANQVMALMTEEDREEMNQLFKAAVEESGG